MGSTHRRVIASLVSIGLIAGIVDGAHATARRDDTDRVHKAVAYLSTQQRKSGAIPAFSPIGSTADAIVAFVAAGTGRPQVKRALAYLERRTAGGKVDTIGLQAKVVTALVAAGRDPAAFGGVNLIKAMRSTIDVDGHYGTSAVFDDALVLIALAAADVKVPDRALTWLLDAQCGDGGWQYDAPASTDDDEHCLSTTDPTNDVFESDTNTTSYVVQAVAVWDGGPFAHDPLAFFSDIRDPDHHGYGYTWGFQTTDANSTALVIQAYAAMGTPWPGGVVQALRELGDPACGGFSFTWVDDPNDPSASQPDDPNPGATIGAIMGLLEQPLPVAHQPVHGHVTPTPACA